MSLNKVVLKSRDISWKDVWAAGGWGCPSFFLHLPSLPDKFQETFPSEFGLANAHNLKSFYHLKELFVVYALRILLLFWAEHTQLRSFSLAFKMYVWPWVTQGMWRAEYTFCRVGSLLTPSHKFQGENSCDQERPYLPDETFASPIYLFLKSGS